MTELKLNEVLNMTEQQVAQQVMKTYIGTQVKLALKEQGLSYRKAAEKIDGVNHVEIGRIFAAEHNYTIDKLTALLAGLGKTLAVKDLPDGDDWEDYIADIEKDGKEFTVFVVAQDMFQAIEKVKAHNPGAVVKGVRIHE